MVLSSNSSNDVSIYSKPSSVEFIMFKRDVEDYLHQLYWDNESRCLVFDAMSCEMIARTIYEHFDLEYCSVFEDNENGAEIYE